MRQCSRLYLLESYPSFVRYGNTHPDLRTMNMISTRPVKIDKNMPNALQTFLINQLLFGKSAYLCPNPSFFRR